MVELVEEQVPLELARAWQRPVGSGLVIDVPKGDCKRKTADARPEEQCCCKHLLADEPDFKAQPTALEELLVAFGTKPLSPDVSPFQTTFSGLWGSFSYVSGELPHVNTVKQFNVVKV